MDAYREEKEKVKMEVVKGEIPWIIRKDWMEEWGMGMDLRKKEVRIGKTETRVKCREDTRGQMRMELRQRRRERG